MLVIIFVLSAALSGCRADFGKWAEELPENVTADQYEIEEKLEYRVSSKVKATEQSTDPDYTGPEGAVLIGKSAEYSDWGEWGEWSDDAITEDDVTEVMTRQANVIESYTTYYYYKTMKYLDPVSGDFVYTYDGMLPEEADSAEFGWEEYKSEAPLPEVEEHDIDGEVYTEYDLAGESQWFYPIRLNDGTIDFYEREGQEANYALKTQYRAREREANYDYEFYLDESAGDYSEWSETKPDVSDGQLLETRTFYRWRKK